MLTRGMHRVVLGTAVCAAILTPNATVSAQGAAAQTLSVPTATSTVAEINAYFDQMQRSLELQYNKLIKEGTDALAAQQAALVALQAIPQRIPALQDKIAVATEALGNLPATFALRPDPAIEAKRRALTDQISAVKAQLAVEEANAPSVARQIAAAQAQITALRRDLDLLQTQKQTALRNLLAQRNKAVLAAQKQEQTQSKRTPTSAVPTKIP